MRKTAFALTCLLSGLPAYAQLPAVLILVHGKILTVDAAELHNLKLRDDHLPRGSGLPGPVML
jgi:hypothetical protein